MTSQPTRFSDLLGHDVRSDPWSLQGASSYRLAAAALEAGRGTDAVALARMTVQEAQEAYDLYALWLEQLPDLLDRCGVATTDLIDARSRSVAAKERLESGWAAYLRLIDDFESLIATGATGATGAAGHG